MRLSRSRPYAGMDGQPLPIPFEAIDRYAQRFGPHTAEGFEWFLQMVQAMDDAWLERQRQG